MAILQGLCLILSLAIATGATAIRYDVVSPAILGQLVAGNEFEWMLAAQSLALLTVCFRRRA